MTEAWEGGSGALAVLVTDRAGVRGPTPVMCCVMWEGCTSVAASELGRDDSCVRVLLLTSPYL